MGCSSSCAKVSNVNQKAKNTKKSARVTSLNDIEQYELSTINESHEKTFNFLTNRIQSIKCTKFFNISPTIVLTKCATPIFVHVLEKVPILDPKSDQDNSKINSENNSENNSKSKENKDNEDNEEEDENTVSVRIPIVAATTPILARILCFSSISMLSIESFKGRDDTSLFFRNCFDWLFSNTQQKTSILFAGFPRDSEAEIARCLESQSYRAEFTYGNITNDSKLESVRCIALTTSAFTASFNEKPLISFLANGGGMCIFYDFNQNQNQNQNGNQNQNQNGNQNQNENGIFYANKFLTKFGIRFTFLANEMRERLCSVSARIPKNGALLRKSSFVALVAELSLQLSKDAQNHQNPNEVIVDNTKIAEIAVTLRNHYLPFIDGEEQLSAVQDLLAKLRDFLEMQKNDKDQPKSVKRKKALRAVESLINAINDLYPQ